MTREGEKKMKKTETIKIPTVKAYTRTIEIYICDLCGYESKDKNMFRTCSICGRLVCQVNKGCARSDPYEMGDYPASFCIKCLELRVKYNSEIDELHEIAYKKEQEIIERIKKESLSL